jgi:hypothetical protein
MTQILPKDLVDADLREEPEPSGSQLLREVVSGLRKRPGDLIVGPIVDH